MVLHLVHSKANRVINGLATLTLVTVPIMVTSLSYMLALRSFILVRGRKFSTRTLIIGMDFVFLIVGKLRSDSSGSVVRLKLDAELSLAIELVLFICLAASFSIRILYLSMMN